MCSYDATSEWLMLEVDSVNTALDICSTAAKCCRSRLDRRSWRQARALPLSFGPALVATGGRCGRHVFHWSPAGNGTSAEHVSIRCSPGLGETVTAGKQMPLGATCDRILSEVRVTPVGVARDSPGSGTWTRSGILAPPAPPRPGGFGECPGS